MRRDTWGYCYACGCEIPPGWQHYCGPNADDPRDTSDRGRRETATHDELEARARHALAPSATQHDIVALYRYLMLGKDLPS